MRRSKKLAAVSMSAMLALSSMAGCTKKDAGDETTQATVATQPDTTADVQTTTAAPAETTAEAAQVNENETKDNGDGKTSATEADKTTEAPEEKTTEAPEEKTTEAPKETEAPTAEVDPGQSGQGLDYKTTDALAKLLDAADLDVKKTNSKIEISVDIGDLLASTVSLTGVKVDIDVDSFIDIAKMQASGTVGVNLNAKELNLAGDLLQFAIDKDHSAINIDAMKLAAGIFGSEDAVTALLQGMGVPVTAADIKKVTSITIPMGSDVVDFKAIDGDALAFAKDYAKRILSGVDASCVSVSGNKYTIKPDGKFITSLAVSAVQNTTEEDIDKLFEILPKVMPELNEEKFEAGMKAIVAQVEKGAKAAGMDTSDLNLDGIEEEISEMKEKLEEAMKQFTEDSAEAKAEIKEQFKKVKERLNEADTAEEMRKAILEINEAMGMVFTNDIPSIVIEANADGMKISFEGEVKLPEEIAANGGVVSFTVNAVSEFNKGEFKDVTNTSEISDVVETVLKLVQTLQSASDSDNGLSSFLGGI